MRDRAKTRLLVTVFTLSVPVSILAQSSGSYKLEEHVINAGGRPAQAVVSSSPSYRLSLDSIGESIAGRSISSASYRMDGGFTSAYPPPGEVAELDLLADLQTLTWSWEPASTAYNVYAGALSALPGGYGGCAASDVEGISWADPSPPGQGNGVFYLVTAVNRLHEEGTKGHASTGVERGNPSPCP